MFSKNLKKAMQNKGYSLTKLSQETRIGKSSISQYLSGKNIPTDKRIGVIAAALEISVDELAETAASEKGAGEKKVFNLSVRTAAKLLGVGEDFVYQGLREGVFPWGYAVKQSTVWTYYINATRFCQVEGIKLSEIVGVA